MAAILVRQVTGIVVANPAVNTSTSTVNPQTVLEPEVLLSTLDDTDGQKRGQTAYFVQAPINDFYCDCDEPPALTADVRFATARTNVIVIGKLYEIPVTPRKTAQRVRIHIDIDDELLLDALDLVDRVPQRRGCIVDGTQIDLY